MKIKHTFIAAAIMLSGVAAIHYTNFGEKVPSRRSLSAFPMQIGEWRGKEERFSDKIYEVLGVDDSIMANYTNPKGGPINLYIGFYDSQRKGDLILSPKNCMPGAGWNIVETNLIDIRQAPGNEATAKVIKLMLQNGTKRQVMLYWFHSRGRIIASEYWQKIYLVLDSIFRHRTDGSFVRLIAPVIDNDEEIALNQLVNFAETIMPLLSEYLPN